MNRFEPGSGTQAVAVACATLLAGCGDDDDARTVRAVIGPGGGQITSHDGVLTLSLLPGALGSDEEFVVSPSDTPPLIFGPAYRVQPDVELLVNAEVTYARELPNDPEGTAVAAIRRADFEAGQGVWVALPTTELDVANDRVTATDTEVSLFYGLLQADDGSATTGSDSGDSAAGTDDNGPLSHATHIQPVWDSHCMGTGTGCHTAGETAPTLEGDAYAAIVGVMPGAAAVPLVTAGDAQLSYLMHKIDATFALDANLGGCGCGGTGSPMPLGAELLDAATRDRVRRWIDEGAMP